MLLTSFRSCIAGRVNIQYYNHRHRTCPKTPLEDGIEVCVSTDGDKVPGTVTAYMATGQLRRKRSHLTEIPQSRMLLRSQLRSKDQPSERDEMEPLPQAPPRSPIMTCSRTGTAIRPPLLQNPELIRLASLWRDNVH